VLPPPVTGLTGLTGRDLRHPPRPAEKPAEQEKNEGAVCSGATTISAVPVRLGALKKYWRMTIPLRRHAMLQCGPASEEARLCIDTFSLPESYSFFWP
jgi:hypothetical protein